MTEKRFVVLSVSIGTASLFAALCLAICVALVFNAQPVSKQVIDVPRVPRGDMSVKEANDLKYGPVNLSAAKEVKDGIFARLRARRAVACQPATRQYCSPVTYAPPIVPSASPPSLLPTSPPRVLPVCPDGDCNQGYMPLPPTTSEPQPAPVLGESEAPVEAVPPDDSSKMQLLVISHANQSPATWFDTDPTLQRVKRSVAFTRIDPGSAMHRERYSYLGNETPIVSLSWGDGRSIYFANGNSMPSFSSQLFSDMRSAVTAAREAQPAADIYSTSQLALTNSSFNPPASPDCPDGNCPLPQDDGFRFPRLRPPADETDNPLIRVATGFLKDGVTSGLWLVFSVVALGFVLVFSIVMLGVIILVVRIFN